MLLGDRAWKRCAPPVGTVTGRQPEPLALAAKRPLQRRPQSARQAAQPAVSSSLDRLDGEDPGDMTRRNVRRCGECSAPLPEGSRRSRRYCSSACRTRAWRQMRARRAQLDAGGEAMRALIEGRPHPWPQFKCPECGSRWYSSDTPFGTRKRSDSRYCSPRCRTRAWRSRLRSAAVTT